ncbi:MAG: hypothetical protein EAX86_09455 [Candidatus Heimdallarchaeota archaeon]|nr:hypothetical protein [Candidatus Heimdallarchaeota archaeon]
MAENEISYKINIIGTPVRHITELIAQSTILTPLIDTNAQQKYNTVIQIIKEWTTDIKVYYTYWKTLQTQQEATPQDKQEFYQDSDGVMLVYDYGVRKSFEDIPDWIEEQKKYTPSTTSVILLGIKAEAAEFSNQMVREQIEELKLKQPYETSLSNPEILLKLGKIFISEMFRTWAYSLLICIIGKNTEHNCTFGRLTADTKFDVSYLPSLGVDIPTKRIAIGKAPIKLIIMITAGQESFGKLRPSYYRGASACLITFDFNDRNTVDAVPTLLAEFRKHIPEATIPIALVGIKTEDSIEDHITPEEGQRLAEKLQLRYYETQLTDKQQVEWILKDIASASVAAIPIILNVCPHCGVPNPQYKHFCPKCEANLLKKG